MCVAQTACTALYSALICRSRRSSSGDDRPWSTWTPKVSVKPLPRCEDTKCLCLSQSLVFVHILQFVLSVRNSDSAQSVEYVCGMSSDTNRHNGGDPQTSGHLLLQALRAVNTIRVSTVMPLGLNRYQQQIGQWIAAELESTQLLSLCLKKLKALNKVSQWGYTYRKKTADH